jgi:CDP-paratose 2-epimerase
MEYKYILVTGGAGFVGSNICIALREWFPQAVIIAFDNLYRRGSELNLPRLAEAGITFQNGDVRFRKQLNEIPAQLIIECSAEPSVLAGVGTSPEYLIDTNLMGALNCFELARKNRADVLFLSTSRVYPFDSLNRIRLEENESRYAITDNQTVDGITLNGINEKFPIEGLRSLYGASKLSAELMLNEYADSYGFRTVINRFGVIAGPWQFGKSDQGIVSYWLGAHMFDRPLAYIGYGGLGKQVRDVIHIDDVIRLLRVQIEHIEDYTGSVFNVGGGTRNSVSLRELTEKCRTVTGKLLSVGSIPETRKNDVKLYVTDNAKITGKSSWVPLSTVDTILEDTYRWMSDTAPLLRSIFTQ